MPPITTPEKLDCCQSPGPQLMVSLHGVRTAPISVVVSERFSGCGVSVPLRLRGSWGCVLPPKAWWPRLPKRWLMGHILLSSAVLVNVAVELRKGECRVRPGHKSRLLEIPGNCLILRLNLPKCVYSPSSRAGEIGTILLGPAGMPPYRVHLESFMPGGAGTPTDSQFKCGQTVPNLT